MAASLGLLSLVKVLVVPTLPVLCVVIPEIINQRHSYIQILHLIHTKCIKLNIHVLSLINTVYIISYETFAYVHTKMYISTKYIINKLVELHVTQLFFLKLGWVGVVWFTCACPSQGVHPVLCGRFVPGTLWMSMC